LFAVVVDVLIIYIALCHSTFNCLGNCINAYYIGWYGHFLPSQKVPDTLGYRSEMVVICDGSFSSDFVSNMSQRSNFRNYSAFGVVTSSSIVALFDWQLAMDQFLCHPYTVIHCVW